MIYFANPTTGTRDAMTAGLLGFIDTPKQGNRRPQGVVWYDGFVVDFAEVKAAVKVHLDKLDHHLLNDVINNPTVEVQLQWWYERLSWSLPVHSLTLYEGLNNHATFVVER